MQKLIALLLSLALLLTMIACSSSTVDKITCTKCGAQIISNSKFCSDCGEQIIIDKEQINTDIPDAENGSNPNQLATIVEYKFIDYKEFSEYWFDGTFRCGTDFAEGDYYILPLFGVGANCEPAKTPDDFSWSKHCMLRKVTLKKGEYVRIGSGAIMVPADEVNTNDWKKYGVFKVGEDILAGQYKMETITDRYYSDLTHMQGIDGAYQLNSSAPNETPIKCNYLFSTQEYITLEDGQYIIITNTKLTNVEASDYVQQVYPDEKFTEDSQNKTPVTSAPKRAEARSSASALSAIKECFDFIPNCNLSITKEEGGSYALKNNGDLVGIIGLGVDEWDVIALTDPQKADANLCHEQISIAILLSSDSDMTYEEASDLFEEAVNDDSITWVSNYRSYVSEGIASGMYAFAICY